MLKLKNKYIGITIGDPSGIGPEVTAKALKKAEIQRLGNFKVFGDSRIFKKYFKKIQKNCAFIDINCFNPKNQTEKELKKAAGYASLQYLNEAIKEIKNGEISALVTAPVSKEAVKLSYENFKGHTEYLADAFGIKNVGMFFVAGNFRVIVATRHVPLKNVVDELNLKNLYETINLTNTSLKKLFKIKSPSIAVCGLNPHAGEAGKIGKEEIDFIIPAIKKANKNSMNISGPFPSDTLFSSDITKKYDAVIAMYHDQGLIPIKTLFFKKVINMTIGLPFIRTSPAHGTAFDIAGKNIADESSMCESIKLAAKLS